MKVPGGRTAVYALLGKPVGHTLSPAMHNAAFSATGRDAVYVAFEVGAGDFPAALAGAHTLGLKGLNVTVPHKRDAYRLAREADDTAKATGAANTLVPCEGGYRAYNTDVAGFLSAIADDPGFEPEGRRAFVLGAGGAARAAVYGLMKAGTGKVYVAAREKDRAKALADEISYGAEHALAVEIMDAPSLLGRGDLMVSATPLGLDPEAVWPVPPGDFEQGVLFYDMAYGRGKTSLEREAAEAGHKSASGQKMLLMQGVAAFELWTGAKAPLEAMAEALVSG